MPEETSPAFEVAPARSVDCGYETLNESLRRFAFQNHQSGLARTYVATRGKRVVGYYPLAFGSIDHQASTARVTKGLPLHPISIMLLARLAVDVREQRCGLGKGLLKDAILRSLQASAIGGPRGLLVYAKDKQAQTFYKKFGFGPSPTHELQLMLLIKDKRKSIE